MKQDNQHKEVIIAWLNGAEVEWREGSGDGWHKGDNLGFVDWCQYRITPEPVVTQKFMNLFSDGSTGAVWDSRVSADKICSNIQSRTAYIISTYHDGKLVSQEVKKVES